MFLYKDKKSGIFQIIYFRNGRRIKKSTKKKTKAEASKVLKLFIANPVQQSRTKNVTLKEFENEYVKFISPSRSPHYIRSIKLSFRKFIDYAGEIPLNEVDLMIVEKFISVIHSKAQRASLLYYRTLKAAFSRAMSWKYIQVNPFKEVKPPMIEEKPPEFLTVEDFNKIVAFVDQNYLKTLYTVMFDTGLRAAEICNMRWHWIDFNKRIICVKNGNGFTTKSKRDRVVPMTNLICDLLVNMKNKLICNDENNFVFTRIRGVKLNEEYISKKFKSAIRMTTLSERIHLHTLRHSFASRLVQKNVSLYIVAKILGHSSLKTTQMYSHLRTDDLWSAMNNL